MFMWTIKILTERRVLLCIERCKCIFGISKLCLYHPKPGFTTESARVPEDVTVTTHVLIWQVQAHFLPLIVKQKPHASVTVNMFLHTFLPVLFPFFKHKTTWNPIWIKYLDPRSSHISTLKLDKFNMNIEISVHIYSEVWSLTNTTL